MMRGIATWLAGNLAALAVFAAALGGAWWHGHASGTAEERERWVEQQQIAERAAKQTKIDLAALAEASARRATEKERLIHERALQLDAHWRATLADLPRCRLPRAVGVHLDAASGVVPDTAPVASAPGPGPDDSALDSLVDLSDALDVVRANYSICRANIDRLIEARQWYTDLRERVNSGVQP